MPSSVGRLEDMNTTAPQSDQATGPGAGPGAGPQDSVGSGPDAGAGLRPLYRPAHDRMLAGVASGLARYLGVDVLLVRIALVVLVFVGGIGLPLYLASWLLIPEEDAIRSILAEFIESMQGWRN
jgi:phage shock protein PspC (stress-responsive transcriptional regulator)